MAAPGSGGGDRPADEAAGPGAQSGGPVVRRTSAARATATAEPPPPPVTDRVARGTWSRGPFVTGFLLAAGGLLAWWFGGLIIQASSVLILVVVALFIAFGLSPVVQWLMRHGVRHSIAVLLVA